MPEAEDKAQALYKNLSDQFDKALQAAKKDGKKLVVAMGEEHQDNGSLLAELMLIKIAKDHGVNDLVMEASDKLLAIMRNDYNAGSDIENRNRMHILEFLSDADQKGMKVIAGDSGVEQGLTFDQREKLMIDTTAGLKDNALYLMGLGHVVGIADARKTMPDKDIVIFDIANDVGSGMQRLEKEAPGEAAIAHLVQHSGIATEFDIGAEFRNMSRPQIIDLVAKVTHEPDLAKLIAPKQLSTDPKEWANPDEPKAKEIYSKWDKVESQVRALYANDDDKFKSPLCKECNMVGVNMLVGDYKTAEARLNNALKLFDKEHSDATAETIKIKMQIGAILSNAHDFNKSLSPNNTTTPYVPPVQKVQKEITH